MRHAILRYHRTGRHLVTYGNEQMRTIPIREPGEIQSVVVVREVTCPNAEFVYILALLHSFYRNFTTFLFTMVHSVSALGIDQAQMR